MVSKESAAALKNNRTLSDDNFNTLQNMLNREYPHVNGLLDPVLGQALQFKVIVRTGYLHQLAISTFGCNNGEVCIMNSLFHGRMLQQTKHQICSLMKCKKAKIVVIAFVRFVTHYKKYPINITFKQSLRRNHAMEALERNKLEHAYRTSRSTQKKVISVRNILPLKDELVSLR